ncbi:efflux RND transporter periplasmic adaptor subunit [Candidatus Nitrospira inopinata]|jgi:cobalt-zinc-cadmium efflux system membrane fusion protein|uniref:Putative Acriflavine resistance protein A n=1 Tax=Candidatus Nitrospira inopinata TaxID=1715989 RepID=A0A0S4KZX0_9BACT|nr:efflux RND transporter periplasmic adaptor subunit [Candidatus Nitrospira inopinata]CUQ68027.1 putative Acriflavine resistance protein A [Candidatus Nitrospira inopinata]
MSERWGWKTIPCNSALVWSSVLLLLAACGRPDQSSELTKTNLPEADKRTASVESTPLIETAIVELGASHQKLTLFGKVAYGEDRYSRISSPLQGRVIEVRARLGDRVKAGDILLVVDSPDIAQAYSEYVKEDSELEYAARAYELAKDLYEVKALALKDLKQAENELVKARAEFRRAKERLLSLRVTPEELDKPLDKQTITSRFELKSPLTGVVVERTVTPGQLVTGEILFTIADLDQLQVLADLYERDVALVKEGQSAVVKVEAYPDVDFPARVTAVGDIVDSATRTIKVRAQVNNKDRLLKPEMFARLQLDLSEAGRFLTLPREAVLEKDGKQFVYVAEDSGRYVKREVKVVNTSSDQVRVLEGIRHGERIVTKGAVLIKE